MSDEVLLGYLLDALDRDERRAVEAHLRAHPEARARLAALRQLISPLDADGEPPEPPPGLAESALAGVADLCARLPDAPPPSPRQAGGPVRRGVRAADLVTAALVLLLAGGLFLTWLARQRRDYQILACQNNLHRLWTALQAYADEHPENGGAFPRVEARPPHNFAGVFVPILADAGALGPDAATACPAVGGKPAPPCSLDALDALARDRPDAYRARTRELGGDYAYTLGYCDHGELFGLSRACGGLSPILADRPGDAGGNSPNHGGGGQNVLCIGGHVRWCVNPDVGVDRDDIYLNLKFRVLAGEHEFDTVLGPSEASPCTNP
jgi:hypothetical protein